MENCLTLRELCKVNPNAFQSILDVFAYSENLALRIVDIEELSKLDLGYLGTLNDGSLMNSNLDWPHKFDELIQKLDTELTSIETGLGSLVGGYETKFPALASLRESEVSPDSNFLAPAHRLRDIERNIFINWPSNLIHLHSLFRLSVEWRWYELVYLNRVLLEQKTSSESIGGKVQIIENAYGLSGWSLFYVPLDDNLSLLVGPIILAPKESYSLSGGDSEFFHDVINGYSLFHSTVCPRSLSRLFNKDDMMRIASSRTPLQEETVRSRTKKTLKYLARITETRGQNLIESLSVSDADSFAQGLVATIRFETENETLPGKTGHICLNLNARSGLSLATDEGITQLCSDSREVKLPLSTNHHSQSRSRLESWSERINARRKNLQTLRVRMTTDWLNYHFMANGGANDSLISNSVGDHVANVILEALRADIAHVYDFNPSKGKVQMRGRAHVLNQEDAAALPLLKQFMEEIDLISPDGTYDSLLAECIAERRTIARPKIAIDDIAWPKSDDGAPICTPPKSVLMAPIVFQDRVLGVIEVKSFSENAFHHSGIHTVNHFASNFGHFFYSQRMIAMLSAMNKNLVHLHPDEIARKGRSRMMDSVADCISSLFVADASTIWLLEADEEDRYSAVGHSGEYLYDKENLSEFGKPSFMLHSPQDSEAIAVRLIDYYKSGKWVSYCVSEVARDESDYDPVIHEGKGARFTLGRKYFSRDKLRSHRSKLLESNFKEIRTFLLTDTKPRMDEKGNVFSEILVSGAITLYYRDVSTQSHWNEVVGLCSGILSDAINEKYYLLQEKRELTDYYNHELRESLKSLMSVFTSLAQDVEKIERRVSKLPKFLTKLSEDKDLAVSSLRDEQTLRQVVEHVTKAIVELSTLEFSSDSIGKRYLNLQKHKSRFEAQIDFYGKNQEGKFKIEDLLQLAEEEIECSPLEVFRDSYFSHKEQLDQASIRVNIDSYLQANGSYSSNDQRSDEFEYHGDNRVISKPDFNGHGIPGGAKVYLPPQGFGHVLNNVFQNIVKYAKGGTTVQTHWKSVNLTESNMRGFKKFYDFEISNICTPSDIPKNPDILLRSGQRLGLSSYGIDPEGDGIGLWFINEYCKQHRVEVSVKFEKDDSRDYRFILKFRFKEDMVLYNQELRAYKK